MIRYALACDDGHRFEAWFRDGAAYETQAAERLLSCPACGSTSIAKSVMAPAVIGAAREATTPMADVALADDRGRELRALVGRFRQKLLAEGRDVGSQFAVEARRMHEGDIPGQQIYGQASLADARDLLEDGILVLPMPPLPDDMN